MAQSNRRRRNKKTSKRTTRGKSFQTRPVVFVFDTAAAEEVLGAATQLMGDDHPSVRMMRAKIEWTAAHAQRAYTVTNAG